MDLLIKDYIELNRLPKLNYFVSYSELFKKQYERLEDKLITFSCKEKSIYFYSTKEEWGDFYQLLIKKKLYYNNILQDENENNSFLQDYSAAFQKGFNSLSSLAPSSEIINYLPYCNEALCVGQRHNTIVRQYGKCKTTIPCLCGHRRFTMSSFISGTGLLGFKTINNITQVRILKDPQYNAFEDGIMYKAIFLAIQRYPDFKEYFDLRLGDDNVLKSPSESEDAKLDKVLASIGNIEQQFDKVYESIINHPINSIIKAEIIDAIKEVSEIQKQEIVEDIINFISTALDELNKEQNECFIKMKGSDDINYKLKLAIPLLNLLGVSLEVEVDVKSFIEGLKSKYELKVCSFLGLV